MDGLGEVIFPDGVGGVEVGDGAGDFKDAVVGAGGEEHVAHGEVQDFLGVGVEGASVADLAGSHLAIVADGAVAAETVPLAVAGGLDAGADDGGGLAFCGVGESGDLDGGDLDMEVDAVEERPGEPGHVAPDLIGGGARFRCGFAIGGGVHGGDEHEARGKRHRPRRPGDRHVAVLEGLAKDLERGALEFRKLVEEEHAIVGEADLTGRGVGAPALKYMEKCYR